MTLDAAEDWDDVRAYDYHLPPRLIAQHPLEDRTSARMLVVPRHDGAVAHRHVRDLPAYVRAGDAIVLNDTRVVPARLVGRRASTGGKWQGLFLEADAGGVWRILSKTRGRLTAGERIVLVDRQAEDAIELETIERRERGEWIVRPMNERSSWDILSQIGRVPLPGYIRGGEMEPGDEQRYQTVYGRRDGAVAAPTAGLHFTEKLLAELQGQGVVIEHVTLHVGIGTFRPVEAPRLSEHAMHFERAELAAETAERLNAVRAQGGRIITVGTTSVRTLETAAASGTLAAWSGETNLFIRPPYPFRACDAILTNFHLPRSTLLALVYAFGGPERMRAAYATAIAERYRFYSYGDCMLIA
ncbi:MAG TPA: tRNA preQ1(34) S-adenosylmethionine ribosyltransferase-isomerase QueA [Pirellulaceae bacterium]|jgi:S-adenosylmethionine:tRNA ribosyltransferase-isomerase|nr:tRNA preQ1(34) S-adenosylmethionine ribosyltransferase-isomerase QueA [Pirellulaceae bacterium]